MFKCRAWNEAVKQEIQLRGIQRMMLNPSKVSMIKKELKVKPHIAIIFVEKEDYSLHPLELIGKSVGYSFFILRVCTICINFGIIFSVASQYSDEFPEKLIPIVANRVHTEKNIRDTDEFGVNRSFRPNSSEIPCLILPKHERLEVKYSWCARDQIQSSTADKIIDDLAPANKGFKTVFLIHTFTCDNKKFVKSIMKSIRNRYDYRHLLILKINL